MPVMDEVTLDTTDVTRSFNEGAEPAKWFFGSSI